ncbi:MAG: helix-hairpin-helix domain-containing protein [Verrucomicrobiales bacterium]
MKRKDGSVLVAVLWCLALLSVLVFSVLHTSRLDLLAVKNHGDLVQAQYLAIAGVEKAKAMLWEEAAARKRSARNHSGSLQDSPADFKDIEFGRGSFRVFYQGGPNEGGQIIYGIRDEESRLNINTATAEELQKIEGITAEVAAAIIDWRDRDNNVTSGGAEGEYYAQLRTPYLPRNDAFKTVNEMLMVAGITPEYFRGEDANLNGLLDPEEDDGKTSYPADDSNGMLDGGWASLLTVHSGVQNVNAAGQERVNVQEAEESELSAIPGLDQNIAKAIVAYRGQNQLENLADLLEVRAMAPAPSSGNRPPNPGSPPPGGRPPGSPPPGGGRPTPGPPGQGRNPENNSGASSAPAMQPTGEKLISKNLLATIGDDVTTQGGSNLPGAVNINTAPYKALLCLPGITEELADAIIRHRESSGYFANTAELLNLDQMNEQIFKQLSPRITARSETFRILCEGKAGSSGARKRIEVIVKLGSSYIDVLAYKEEQ